MKGGVHMRRCVAPETTTPLFTPTRNPKQTWSLTVRTAQVLCGPTSRGRDHATDGPIATATIATATLHWQLLVRRGIGCGQGCGWRSRGACSDGGATSTLNSRDKGCGANAQDSGPPDKSMRRGVLKDDGQYAHAEATCAVRV